MSIKTLYNDFYGDETRWWVGVVESVDDPLFQGRLKVRIYGVHSASATDIPRESLPWAQVIAPVTQGGTSGINGTPVGIQPYAQVFGIFLDGKHSQLPLVLGSIPRVDGVKPDTEATSLPGGRGTPASAPPETTSGNTSVTNNRKANPDESDPRGEAARTSRSPAPITPVPGVTPSAGSVQRKFVQLEGGTDTEKAYNYFEKHFRENEGLANSKELAAGFCGNFIVESQFKSNIENSIGAVGIAQWLGERRTRLRTWSIEQGYDLVKTVVYPGGGPGKHYVPDLEGQLAFVIEELDKLNWLRWDDWKNTCTTAEIAADRVEAFYEISEFSVAFWKKDVRWKYAPFEVRKNSGRDAVGAYGRRLKEANNVYMSFAVGGTS